MQIAAQSPALFLQHGDDALPGSLQIGGQPRGMGGDPDLTGQILEQAAVGRTEGLARAPRRDDQLANGSFW